jgi:hypothetical protein
MQILVGVPPASVSFACLASIYKTDSRTVPTETVCYEFVADCGGPLAIRALRVWKLHGSRAFEPKDYLKSSLLILFQEQAHHINKPLLSHLFFVPKATSEIVKRRKHNGYIRKPRLDTSQEDITQALQQT